MVFRFYVQRFTRFRKFKERVARVSASDYAEAVALKDALYPPGIWNVSMFWPEWEPPPKAPAPGIPPRGFTGLVR